MSKNKLNQSTKSAIVAMKNTIASIKGMLGKKNRLTNKEISKLGELYVLGNQFRRVVVYFLYKTKHHEKENCSFSRLILGYFGTSKSEAYKLVARSRVELTLLNNDESQLGQISNNSVLDNLEKVRNLVELPTEEFFERLVEKCGGLQHLNMPDFRDIIQEHYSSFMPCFDETFCFESEYLAMKSWQHDYSNLTNGGVANGVGFKQYDANSFPKWSRKLVRDINPNNKYTFKSLTEYWVDVLLYKVEDKGVMRYQLEKEFVATDTPRFDALKKVVEHLNTQITEIENGTSMYGIFKPKVGDKSLEIETE